MFAAPTAQNNIILFCRKVNSSHEYNNIFYVKTIIEIVLKTGNIIIMMDIYYFLLCTRDSFWWYVLFPYLLNYYFIRFHKSCKNISEIC
jgi:hypothetical protein